MNTLTDDDVIARLRTALDEVAAADPVVPESRPWAEPSTGRMRWLGIAAAAVLTVGAVGWAVTRDTSSPTADLPGTPAMPSVWYELTAPGFSAQPPQVTAPPSGRSAVWFDRDGASEGVVAATQSDGSVTFVGERARKPLSDGSALVITASELDDARVALAVEALVPADGRWRLDDPSFEQIGFSTDTPRGWQLQQSWISDVREFATVVVTPSTYPASQLGSASSITDTTIAGIPAYRAVGSTGVVFFVWNPEPGMWAILDISEGLTARADELAASLIAAPVPEIAPAPAIEETPATTAVAEAPATTDPAFSPEPVPPTSAAADGSVGFMLVSPDLAPGQPEVIDAPRADGAESLFWEFGFGNRWGLVIAERDPAPTAREPVVGPGVEVVEWEPVGPDERRWTLIDGDRLSSFWARASGEVWTFHSVGLTRSEFERIITPATEGSGLPIVIPSPNDASTYPSLIDRTGPATITTSTSAADISVVLQIGGDVLAAIDGRSTSTVEVVSVAQRRGWRITDDSGGTVVVWEVGDGRLASMTIPAVLLPRVDGLILAVAQV
jgi:hypothetical protein